MENPIQTTRTAQTWESRAAFIKPGGEAFRKTQESLVRSARNALKAADVLDLPALRRHLASAKTLLTACAEQAAAWEESIAGFDLGAVAEEEYARAFQDACSKAGIARLEGRFPVYEAFPLEIRISLSEEQALINNRVCRTMDPAALATAIKKELDRLAKSRFNEGQFMDALVRAHDLLVAESRATRGRPVRQVRLKQIYRALTLRGRSQYPERLFAYDIGRLRDGSDLVCDGRRLVFGHVRAGSGAIAVPSHSGTDYLGYLELEEVEGT